VKPRGGESGVVLLLVLVVIVLSASTVFTFARRSLLDILSARQRSDRVRAELLARSGVGLALRALGEDRSSSDPIARALESSRDPWLVLGQAPIVVDVDGDGNADGELRIQVLDAGGRIPLRALLDQEGKAAPVARDFLRQALERVVDNLPGRREEKRYDTEAIADGIIDWMDQDKETRLGDDEAKYYEDRGAARGPVDRKLVSLAELAPVPGMDGTLLNALGDYFAPAPEFPRSEGGGLNPNTAPPHLLALLYLVANDEGRFVEDEDIYSVLKARKDGQVFCPAEGGGSEEDCTDFASTLGAGGETIFPPLAFQTNIFAVRVRARMGSAQACVTTVVNREKVEKIKPLAYRLGC
jgi:type II secretory pathway component PulK